MSAHEPGLAREMGPPLPPGLIPWESLGQFFLDVTGRFSNRTALVEDEQSYSYDDVRSAGMHGLAGAHCIWHRDGRHRRSTNAEWARLDRQRVRGAHGGCDAGFVIGVLDMAGAGGRFSQFGSRHTSSISKCRPWRPARRTERGL